MKLHTPVMLNEVIHLLAPGSGKHFVDCTFGRGGHTKELLRYGGFVSAMDRDPRAVCSGLEIQSLSESFLMHWGLFSQMILPMRTFDGVLFDFGVSSPQINDMSFSTEAPLRMTMGINNIDAHYVVNKCPERILESIISELGEEPRAAAIAKNIVAHRRKKSIDTTTQLAKIIHEVAPRRGKDPATQTFQAIRMYVNDEINEIHSGLVNACRLVKSSGIIVAITFHSLEDRVVKNFFQQNCRLHSKAIFPTIQEIRSNRRSRSAKLRWARVD